MAMSGSTRTIWIMAATAVVSLGAGLGLSQLIISPAEQAANAAPPEAGPITVPVELRELSNDVVLRADAVYEDPVSVTLETGEVEGRAVVTGQVPEVGATLEAGAVVLEVAGRPVILLPGELPVYRTLRAGVSGPDVLQLKAALGALGIGAGDPASDDYDAATAAGVVALYARVGYPAPTAGTEVEERVKAAEQGVAAAQEQLAAARRELSSGGTGPSSSERIGADNAIREAERAVGVAQAEMSTDDDGDGTPDPPTAAEQANLANLQDQVAAAYAARADLLAPRDTSALQGAVTAAQKTLTDAQTELASARRDTLTPLPAGELVYLASTPRRVDTVDVKRGSTVSGSAVMSVSGATLQLTGNVSEADSRLLTVGLPAVVELPSGAEVPATVQSIGGEDPSAQGGTGGEQTAGSGRTRVVVVPDALTEEQRAELQGANVRVTVPVGATQGEVLAVPTAALTAGPGGEARVEVADGDEETHLVTVTTGLAAGGFVEVTAADGGTLAEGDRVVVGVTSAEDPEGAGDEPTEDPEADDA